MREMFLPEKLAASVNRLYPSIWRQIDEIRALEAKDAWPGEVFLPMRRLVDMGKSLFGVSRLSPGHIAELNRIGAASAWRPAQDIVRFDPQVYEAVVSTPLTGNFPVNVLWRLPAWAIHIESPGLRLMDAVWDGFTTRLDIARDGQKQLRMYFMAADREIEFALPLGEWTIEDALRATIAKTRSMLGSFGMNVPEMEEFDALDGITRAINLVLYVCSYGLDDIIWQAGNSVSYPAAKRVKNGWRLFPPEKPQVHVLGRGVGARIREAAARENRGGTHASPRPHVRRAHWHGFWSGPRDSLRNFATKWLPPIPVAMGSDAENPREAPC